MRFVLPMAEESHCQRRHDAPDEHRDRVTAGFRAFTAAVEVRPVLEVEG